MSQEVAFLRAEAARVPIRPLSMHNINCAVDRQPFARYEYGHGWGGAGTGEEEASLFAGRRDGDGVRETQRRREIFEATFTSTPTLMREGWCWRGDSFMVVERKPPRALRQGSFFGA